MSCVSVFTSAVKKIIQMTKLNFKELFKIWMFTSFDGANESNTTKVWLVKERDKLKQKPKIIDEVFS